jgi:hypothetical protein
MYQEQLTQALSIAAAPIHPAQYAAGTQNTGGLDMQLFKRATFLLDVGAFGGGGTIDMKLQESTDNITFTDLAGTNVAITQLVAAGGNNRLATLEVRADQLTKRYVRALVTIGVAATIFGCLPLGGEAIHKPGNVNDVAAVVQRAVVA